MPGGGGKGMKGVGGVGVAYEGMMGEGGGRKGGT